MSKGKIYTSVESFVAPENYEVYSYKEMQPHCLEWVEQRIKEGTATKSELRFKEELDKKGIVYIEQAFFCIRNKFFFLDFFLPEYNIAVEIDGGYHTNQQEYDHARDNLFAKIGITTKRLWNRQTKKVDIDEILKWASHKKAKKRKIKVDKEALNKRISVEESLKISRRQKEKSISDIEKEIAKAGKTKKKKKVKTKKKELNWMDYYKKQIREYNMTHKSKMPDLRETLKRQIKK